MVFSSDVSLHLDWAWDTSGLNCLPGLFYFDKSKGQYAPSLPFLHGQCSPCHHSTADMFDIMMWKFAGDPNLKCSFLKYEWYWIFRMLEIQTGFCFAAIPSSSVQWTKAKSSQSVNFLLWNLIEILELLLVFSLVYEIWRKQVVLDKNWERCILVDSKFSESLSLSKMSIRAEKHESMVCLGSGWVRVGSVSETDRLGDVWGGGRA